METNALTLITTTSDKLLICTELRLVPAMNPIMFSRSSPRFPIAVPTHCTGIPYISETPNAAPVHTHFLHRQRRGEHQGNFVTREFHVHDCSCRL